MSAAQQDPQPAPAAPTDAPGAAIVAHAAAEAAVPDADTANARECPFCVMMRQGGCEVAFRAFMECGERADQGKQDMAACLPQFEQLNLCMEKNKDVFDVLLKEMSEEEAAAKAQAQAVEATGTGAMLGHMQEQQQQQQQQGEQQQQQPEQAWQEAPSPEHAQTSRPAGSAHVPQGMPAAM